MLGAGHSWPGRKCTCGILYLPVISILGSCGCSRNVESSMVPYRTSKTRTGFNDPPVPYCFVSIAGPNGPVLPCHGCHGTARSVDSTSPITPQIHANLDQNAPGDARAPDGHLIGCASSSLFEHSRWVRVEPSPISRLGLSTRSSVTPAICLLTPVRSSPRKSTSQGLPRSLPTLETSTEALISSGSSGSSIRFRGPFFRAVTPDVTSRLGL